MSYCQINDSPELAKFIEMDTHFPNKVCKYVSLHCYKISPEEFSERLMQAL